MRDTGALMAYIRYCEGRREDALFFDASAEKFIQPDSPLLLEEKKHLYPYFDQLMVVRHKLFMEEIQALIEKESGIRQVVSVGAGYCTMVNDIMHKNAHIKGFEVDRSVVIDRKKKRVVQHYSPIQIACNLETESESLYDKLKQSGFDTTLQSLFFLEGMLYYLPSFNAISTLFQQLSYLMPPSSFLLFDMQENQFDYSDNEKDFTTIATTLDDWKSMFTSRGLTLLKERNIALLDRWGRLDSYENEICSSLFLTQKT